MNVIAFVCLVIAAVLAFVVAIGATITTHDPAWSMFFFILGIALDHLPAIVVRRGP